MKKNVTLNINAQLDSYTTTKNKLTKRSKTVEIRSSQLSESRYTEKIDSILLDRVVYRFKVILLGDIGVGKTSILTRFVEGRYNSEYHCNVGVEFKVKSLFIDEAIGADLKIWDTCGEEKFRSLTRQYYREGNGVLLIFDLTNRNSFDKLITWMDDISQYGSKEVKLILVGNKSDLYTERVVPFKEAEEFASKNNLKYIEVSAKTGNNIVLLFERITEMMIRSEVENEIKGKGKDKTANHVIMNKSLTIQNKTDVEIIRKKSKGCCS